MYKIINVRVVKCFIEEFNKRFKENVRIVQSSPDSSVCCLMEGRKQIFWGTSYECFQFLEGVSKKLIKERHLNI